MARSGAREIIEIRCKSVLNRVTSEKMPFRWSINPYRGCEHRCVYCFARRYHTFLDLNPAEDFENKIFVKVNAPEVLRQELARPGWRRETVAIGTAVDPYQPVEGKYKLTRRILEVLLDAWTPCSIVTKNAMILRDIDLLLALGRGPGCSVAVSLTTLDEALAKKLEPDTPPPRRRLETVSELVRAGVHAGVMIAPILPGLTDGPALERLVEEALAYGARFVNWAVLRLYEGVKEVYFDFIKAEAPGLLPMYGRMYGGAFAPAEYVHRIDARLTKAREGPPAARAALRWQEKERALGFGRVPKSQPARASLPEAGRPLCPLQLELQFS